MSQDDIAVIHDCSITEHGDNVASSSSQQGGADAIIQIPEEQLQPTPVVKVNPRYLLQTQDTLTPRELDDVTTVFKQFEIGLREGCINVKVGNMKIVREMSFNLFPGLAHCSRVFGCSGDGTRGYRHDQCYCKRWTGFLPRVLLGCSEKVPRGR